MTIDDKTLRINRRACLVAVLAPLAGCGGGVDSGGTGTGMLPTYALGPITGFGSIVVNGVRYDESAARISDDDGVARTSADLRLGMRVELTASAQSTVAGVTSAVASSVRVRAEIRGPVQAIDATRTRLTVLGQDVAVVATTVIDGGMAQIAVGDVVEVHATLDRAAGRYVASRIERQTSIGAYKLRGVVAALDLTQRTIDIGAARIAWAQVAPADPAAALAPGRLVRVTLATAAQGGVWTATALAADATRLEDREVAEIEGRVTAFTSAFDFALDGIAVSAASATFPDGTAWLALGAKAEVNGALRGGVLIASRVEREDDEGGDEAFEIEGRIDAVDTPAQRFLVRGVTVVWSAATRFDSGTPADLVVGRRVEVKGQLSSDGTRLEATVVHVER
jgi:hypothetical protein